MDMNIIKLLDIVEHILTIIVLLVGAVGFVFRAWISEWIKTRFSKVVNRELESQKHELNKELESFKNSLFQQLEHAKANIDIKRSIALKMAEAQLDSVREFLNKLDHYHNVAMSMPCHEPEVRKYAAKEFYEVTDQVRLANRNAHIFIPNDLNAEIASHIEDIYVLASSFLSENRQAITNDDGLLEQFRKRFVNIHFRLKKLIFEVPVTMI